MESTNTPAVTEQPAAATPATPAPEAQTTDQARDAIRERFSRLVNLDGHNKENLERLAGTGRKSPGRKDTPADTPVPAVAETPVTPEQPATAPVAPVAPITPQQPDRLAQLEAMNQQLLAALAAKASQPVSPADQAQTTQQQIAAQAYLDIKKMTDPNIVNDPEKWYGEINAALTKAMNDVEQRVIDRHQQIARQQEQTRQNREMFFTTNPDLKQLESNPQLLATVTNLAESQLRNTYGEAGLQVLAADMNNLSKLVGSQMRKVIQDLGINLGAAKQSTTPIQPAQTTRTVITRQNQLGQPGARPPDAPELTEKEQRFRDLLNDSGKGRRSNKRNGIL